MDEAHDEVRDGPRDDPRDDPRGEPQGRSQGEPQDEVRSAAFTDLDALTAYRLWALRSDVFVVEQDCPYLDLDGRDLEPGTRHLWLERGGVPVATLRVLDDTGADDGALRIGRVATARAWRGRGFAARLVSAVLEGTALEGAGERDVVLDAQSHLVDWYAGFGFTPSGRGFVEDGIPHTPMRRPAGG